MKAVYEVYVYSTSKSFLFSTRKKANEFVQDFYQEYLDIDKPEKPMTLEQFKLEEGVYISEHEVD